MQQTIWQAVALHGKVPDRTALFSPYGEARTYESLAAQAERVHEELASVLGPDEPVAIAMASNPDAVAALLGAETSGHPAVLLPVNLRAGEMRSVLIESGASVLLAPPGASLPSLGPAAGTLGGLQRFVIPHVDPRVCQAAREALPPDAFICQLTSGSTGASRWAVRSHAAVLREAAAVVEQIELARGDLVVCASSIAHSYGLVGGLLAPLLAGSRIGLATSAIEVLLIGESEEPTVLFGLPGTYSAVADFGPGRDKHPHLGLRRLRVALSAGSPLDPDLFTRFAGAFGLPIRQDYGTTETGTIAIDYPGEATSGCVGRALSHMEVRVGSPPGRSATDLQTSEILVRSSAVAAGYLIHGSLVPCVDGEGWYHTGDLGALDETRRLWLTGRLREPIVVGDAVIRPDTVEAAIRRVPGVQEVVVLATTSPTGARGFKAVVVAPGLDRPDLVDRLQSILAPAEQPAVVELCDDLPRSPAGKILQKYM